MRRFVASVALLFFAASPALANDFVSDDDGNWYRYSSGDITLTSRIEREVDGWTYWSEFGGMGPKWTYTESGHDYLWVWNDDTEVGEVFANLSARTGARFEADIDEDHTGTFRIGGRNLSITTPVGSFDRVTKVELEGPFSNSGVEAIWFAEDVGIVRWTERTSSGTQTFSLSAAFVDGEVLSGATTVSADDVVAPAEFEDVEAILWGCNDTYMVLDTYIDAFRGLHGRSPRILSDVTVASEGIASELRYELVAEGVPLQDVEIYVAALDSVWMRDYGPIVLRDQNGDRVVGDMNYYWDRQNDNAYNAAYAAFRGWPRVHADLSLEGGNFISDGDGFGMVSEGALWFNSDLTQAGVEAELAVLGLQRVEFFQPLINEGTTHIDMYNKLVSPTRAIVSSYPTGHRQKPVVDAAARRMRALGYSVSRIRAETSHDEFATYANSVTANGIALIPQYGHASRDRNARRVYERLGFEAIGVDCRQLITYGGAVHCISMQVPRR